MAILSNDALHKENKGNALAIGKEAREAKARNPLVIDSTIGMLFDEQGNFLTFKTVEKITKELSGKEKYSYGSTIGDAGFHEAIYQWIFKEEYENIKKKMFLRAVATPGGSGAICNTFSNYLEAGQKVLLPSLMWTNYIQVAREEHLGYETYCLFDDNGHFNCSDFKKQCEKLALEQHRVLVVINDPCQNPTGYSMTYEEWTSVIAIINEIASEQVPVILLYDMAYCDYDKRGSEYVLKNICLFTQLNENALAIMAFSGSKTLGLYGLRIGAQIAMSCKEEVVKEFLNANDYSARGKWSGASTLGQNIIKLALTKYREEFKEELAVARKLLTDRADAFLRESKLVGLKHYPYDCGFFVTIPCEKPQEMFELLKKKGLYILPLQRGIRLTLSSITLKEVIRAVHMIQESFSNCE